MLLIQQLVAAGHIYHLSGEIPRHKLRGFMRKLELFNIARDAPGRHYDRKKGRASVHLVVVELDVQTAFWCLLSTGGKKGLADPESADLGRVLNCRLKGQHLRFLGYELLHQEKKIEKVAGSTWTWRLTASRYKELEAAVVAIARERKAGNLAELVERQSSMPLFSGVRGQVLKLNALAKKLSMKFKRGELSLPSLPYMVKQSVYDSPPLYLDAWLNYMDYN